AARNGRGEYGFFGPVRPENGPIASYAGEHGPRLGEDALRTAVAAMLAACLAGPAFAGSPGDFAETASPAAAKGDRLPMGDADRLPVLVTAAEPQDTFLANLGRGRLVVDGNGCLRHGDAFVIWTYGSRISRTGDGRI